MEACFGGGIGENPSTPMNCFYHPNQEAIGTCKSCGKGLCAACATDLGKGLACRNRCEADAQAMIDLVSRGIARMPADEKTRTYVRSITKGAIAFRIVVGAVFLLWGLTNPSRLIFTIVMGIVFIIYGIVGLIQARR